MKPTMEDESIEAYAVCGHPIDIRFAVGTPDWERQEALDLIAMQSCSFCKGGSQ